MSKRTEIYIKPFKFYYRNFKSEDDKFFYFGRTWQLRGRHMKDEYGFFDLYGYHLIIWRFNFVFCSIGEH